MKPSYKIGAVVAATLVALRLAITLRTGAIGGDDTWLLVRCFGWWHDGDVLPLLSTGGSKGFLYVGFHHFVWATLAGLCHFRLGPLFLVHAVLMVTPALVLGWQLRGHPEARWAMFLGLSSPLMAYFSQSLHPLWWFAPLGGNVAFQVAAREDRGKPLGPFGLLLVGLGSGYLCSVYPSLSPLSLGLFFWLLLKRKPWRAHAAFLAGCVVGYTPCLVLLVSRWNQLTPQPVAGQGPLAWAPLLAGIFRYFGNPPVEWMNLPAPWTALKQGLSTATVALWLLLLAGWMLALLRGWRERRAIPGGILLAACSLAAFIPFTLVTRTESWFHQAGNLWWISALVVPWVVQQLVPRQARVVLAALVGFNAAGLLLIFGPRLLAGTRAEGRYEPASGPGPSWWMQQQMADELAHRASEELAAGDRSFLAVRCASINVLPQTLPRLFRLQHPDLDRKVGWVPEGTRTCTVLVAQDPEHPHRLRLFDWTKTWPLPAQPFRRAVRVLIAGGAATSGQIALDLGPTDPVPYAILDTDGGRLPFWLESRPTEGAFRRIWLKIPPVPAGAARFFLYYGGPAETDPARPEEVFDLFEDFDHDLSGWRTSGAALWRTARGRASVQSPVALQDEIFSSLMRPEKVAANAVLEASVRFRVYPTRDDLGLVFAAGEDGRGYTGYLDGQAAVYLGAVIQPNLVETIGGTNWLWKLPKAGHWTIFQIEWCAPFVRALVDQREIFRSVLVDAPEAGRVGLGIRRGSGQPAIDVEWFRVRRAYPNQPRVILGAPESRLVSPP